MRNLSAGIVAGSVAAVGATLVSLPLRSPDDALLNSATVTLGSLAAGIAAGLLWKGASSRRKGLLIFSLLWTGAFGIVAAISVAGETQLDNFIGFVLPLAAIAFPVTGVITVLLVRSPYAMRWSVAAIAIVIALAVGISLAGQGDQESGRLELPPRAYDPAPSWTLHNSVIVFSNANGFPEERSDSLYG